MRGNEKLLYKTKMCEARNCKFDKQCHFAHSPKELRTVLENVDKFPEIAKKTYKKRLCKNYWIDGTCDHTDNCMFIHDEQMRRLNFFENLSKRSSVVENVWVTRARANREQQTENDDTVPSVHFVLPSREFSAVRIRTNISEYFRTTSETPQTIEGGSCWNGEKFWLNKSNSIGGSIIEIK